MICPYNGFRECDWENCAARMYVTDKKHGLGHIMRVCAIAYNGGEAPKLHGEGRPDPHQDK